MRGFSAPTYTPAALRDLVYDPTIHAPICFAAPAARAVLPYYELRHEAGARRQGRRIRSPTALQAAYVKGELPRRDGATFAYMFSAHQHLGPGIGAWHPHMMVFVPYADAATVGADTVRRDAADRHRRRRHAVRGRRDPGRRAAVRASGRRTERPDRCRLCARRSRAWGASSRASSEHQRNRRGAPGTRAARVPLDGADASACIAVSPKDWAAPGPRGCRRPTSCSSASAPGPARSTAGYSDKEIYRVPARRPDRGVRRAGRGARRGVRGGGRSTRWRATPSKASTRRTTSAAS